MSLFHFNVYDGITIIDDEGTDFPTWREAQVEAIEYAGEILKADSKRIALGEDWRMEVTDHAGLMLFRLNFQVMESATMLGVHNSKSIASKT